MMLHKSRLVGLTLLLVACAPSVGKPEWQAELEKLAENCGVPKSVLHLEGDELTIGGDPNLTFTQMNCVLEGLKSTSFPGKIGFIGNEADH